MFESLVEATALPNLHPAVVHFPLVIVPLALIFDLVGTAVFAQKWLRSAATSLWVAAPFSAWFAVWAGEQAADGLVGVPARVQPHIGEHSDWAHYALYALAVVAALRLALFFYPKLKDKRWPHAVFTVLGAATLYPLLQTADLGGGLVYQHGIGVGVSQGSDHGHESETGEQGQHESHDAEQSRTQDVDGGGDAAGAGQNSVTLGEHGTLTWTPSSGGGQVLGTVLTAPVGADLSAVSLGDRAGDSLALEVDGKAVLLLRETFSDVQVEATFGLSNFEGSVGVAHHVDGSDGGYFSISTDGLARLWDVRGGKQNELAKESVEVPSRSFKIAVNSSGRHLKGLLDGATVAHGHVAPGSGNRIGLLLDGLGTVLILEVSAVPLSDSE